ncbi:hypothetical protein C8F04DRAFT_1329307, partial [Mycena alexandri]
VSEQYHHVHPRQSSHRLAGCPSPSRGRSCARNQVAPQVLWRGRAHHPYSAWHRKKRVGWRQLRGPGTLSSIVGHIFADRRNRCNPHLVAKRREHIPANSSSVAHCCGHRGERRGQECIWLTILLPRCSRYSRGRLHDFLHSMIQMLVVAVVAGGVAVAMD